MPIGLELKARCPTAQANPYLLGIFRRAGTGPVSALALGPLVGPLWSIVCGSEALSQPTFGRHSA